MHFEPVVDDLYATGDFHLHALAHSGSECDEDDVAFLMRVMSIRAGYLEFRTALLKIASERVADAAFIAECEGSLQSHELRALAEIKSLLRDWWPSLRRMDMRH